MGDMAQSSAHVVVIGDGLIDEIHDDGGVKELVGGAALNVAVGIRRLGIASTLIAMVGEDEAGAHIAEYLKDHDVALLASDAPFGSSRAFVRRAPNGEPEYAFNDAAKARTIRYDADVLAAIAEADLVVVSCFPFDVPAEVDALLAATNGVRLVVDPNPRSGMLADREEFVRGFERVAAVSTLVKVGADDAALLYGSGIDSLRARLRELGVAVVLATAGADGAVVESDGGVVRAPIVVLPGRIVDTVGAGDATLAAVAVGLIGGGPHTESGWSVLTERAMEIAAATCRAEGGLLRTPESLAGMNLDGLGT